MIGIARPLLLLLLPLGAVADAGQPLLQDPPTAQDQIPAGTGVDGALLDFQMIDERLTVPVAVGGRGPYNFIIDTGAERTVISRELAGTLQLAPGGSVNLTSMTERSPVDTVIIPEFAIQSIGDRHTIQAPALLQQNLGAQGLLGIDTLAGHKVAIDFESGRMTVARSARRSSRTPASRDEIVVTARSRYGQLIVTDAYYGSTRIQVVLDTGSQVSMGNGAFRRLVGRRLRGAIQTIKLTSVTGGQAEADYALVPNVHVGNVRFQLLPVAFADVAPFERFGLTRRPALLLGMDALRSFRHVEIDFANREVRFRMPRPGHLPRI